jgi:putative transposase
MIAFIDDHRASHRGRADLQTCRLPRPPIYDHLAKRADPTRLSDRAKRDEALRPRSSASFEENFKVYGVRKVWRQMRREGFDVARCTVARLMKDMGLEGVIRGKKPERPRSRQGASHARWTR